MKNKATSVFCVAALLAANAALGLGSAAAVHPWRSFFLYAAAFAALYIYCFHPSQNDAKNLHGVLFIIATGILLRLLFLNVPLSDDVNRYAWEGLIQQQGINPYITAPAEMEQAFANESIFAGINHKEVSAIYPPVAMLAFRAVSALRYSLTAYKVFFVGCDMLLLILLVPLIRRWQRPVHWLALYAWNPLVLLYGAGEGHFDVLYLLFMAASFLAFTHRRSAWAGFFLLGMAVLTKYLCIIFLPFLITRKNRRAFPFFFLPFLTFLPFVSPGMSDGLAVFTGEMAYNDVIPRLLRLFFPGQEYLFAMLAVFTFGYALIWFFNQNRRFDGMLYAYLWCILCLPCVHGWYLMPLALLLIRAPNRAAFLLMITSGLAFHVMHRQWFSGEWRESGWIWCATYLPFFLLLIRDWNASGLPWQRRFPPPETIDILIPVHNEAARIIPHLRSLQEALAQIQSMPVDCRILVVDGGSTDGTAELIAKEPVEPLQAPRGRGTQLAAGYEASAADLMVLLPADSLVDPDALRNLLKTLQSKSAIGWGILGHCYDTSIPTLRVVRLLNRIRFHLFGIAFGDQGIFFRREILLRRGGMPVLPLMEDVELSLRLAGIPRISLGQSLVISARRWEHGRAPARALRIIGMVFAYLLCRRLGGDIRRLSFWLYSVYYQTKNHTKGSIHV